MSLSRLHCYRLRLLHTSPRSCNRVGPIDPISNIRPVIYDDDHHHHDDDQDEIPTFHPYSLHEFRHTERTNDALVDYELRWKLHKQQLDAFNHAFWTESNTRFEAGKTTVLSTLSESATEFDRENVLTNFYRQWLQQERANMDDYTNEWRRRNFQEIMLAARVHYHRFTARLFTPKTRQ